MNLEYFESVRVPVICIIGAAQSVEHLPIEGWREIRPIKGARASDQFCAALVVGDSLSGDGIYDGDYLIFKLNFEPYEIAPGTIAAALTPYGLLVKHVYITLDDQIRLVSSNPNYDDLLLDGDDVVIQGIAVRVERDI